ncbi:MAG TPA: CPBP family intramembrane glutamic endopeptidase [Enhygromyxa sp.]|nr:CPBP family intramembrane glutamic endopeptidase [Enhygromyxa sp.]
MSLEPRAGERARPSEEISSGQGDARRELDEALAERRRVSVFIVYLIPLLCGFMFVTEWLRSMTAESVGTTIYTLPIIAVITLVLIRPIRSLGLPWAAYGITRARWRASLRDGLLFAIPAVLAATALKLALVSLSPAHAELPVFDCLATLTRELGSPAAALRHFVLFNLAYVVLVVPLQELIARGLLQGLLERFIVSEQRTVLAILISNLIFGSFHLYLSVEVAIATIVLGVYLGSIYVRTRNLIGAWVAHAIIGTWVLTVIRLHAIVP